MITRRQFVAVSAAAFILAPYGRSYGANSSPLIYISPLKSDGSLSRCQAEVWFLHEDGHDYVVTSNDAWRAEAVRLGLSKAKVWVGDVGRWRVSGGKYKDLPSHMATVEFETNHAVHARLLTMFGQKYADEWDTWGPRFRDGLADGSRVLLRYTRTPA